MEALLHAAKARLQDALSLDDALCDIQPDGTPEPSSGEWYYAVHPTGVRQDSDQAHRVAEVYSFSVTITRRAGFTPVDRVGTEIVGLRTTGLYAQAMKVRKALHGNWATMAAANAIITADLGAEANGFVEPPLLSSVSAPRPQGGGWFSGDAEPTPPSGYSVEVAFHAATRHQKTSDML